MTSEATPRFSTEFPHSVEPVMPPALHCGYDTRRGKPVAG